MSLEDIEGSTWQDMEKLDVTEGGTTLRVEFNGRHSLSLRPSLNFGIQTVLKQAGDNADWRRLVRVATFSPWEHSDKKISHIAELFIFTDRRCNTSKPFYAVVVLVRRRPMTHCLGSCNYGS